MKKVFTILFIFVILLSGITVRFSAHYCQGAFIASKLSITGKNASCGMTQEKNESKDLQFSDLMCVNEITSYTVSNDYVFSPQVPDAANHLPELDLTMMITPKIISLPALTGFRHFPPGSPGGPLKVESEVLCVFRI